ncbi:MAG: response regulator [Bacteroidetes bacterium]|nr:response regulator [Bacteroidota bacterium]
MAYRFVLFLLLFLYLFQIFGQVANEMIGPDAINSYQHLQELDVTIRIDSLNELAESISRDNPDSCIAVASEAKFVSVNEDYQKGIADASLNMGNAYFYLDSLKLSITNYLNALRIYEALGPSIERGYTLEVMQTLNLMVGKFEKAKKYGRQALKDFVKLEKHRLQCWTLINLSRICTENQEYDSANFYQDSVLSILKIYPDDVIRSHVYFHKAWGTNLANDSAIAWFNKALQLDTIQPLLKAMVLNNLGFVYHAKGGAKNFETARECYLEALLLIGSQKTYAAVVLWNYRGLAEIAYDLGQYDKAIQLLKKGVSEEKRRMSDYSIRNYVNPIDIILDRYYNRWGFREAYALLYDIYIAIDDSAKALSCYIVKEKINNEIVQTENNRLLALLEAESENEKTLNQVSLLAKENRIKNLQINRSKTIIYGLGAMLLIIILVGFIFIRQRRIKMMLKEQKLQFDLELEKREKEKLMELDSMKSRFFANISHEFRTPLTLILGPIDKIKASVSSDLSTDLDIIKRNALRLHRLITSLLNLSKLESGKLQLYISEINLVKTTGLYLKSFESLAREREIKLEFDSEAGDIFVFVDVEKFERILFNLLSNAFKFTPRNGIIKVKIEKHQDELGVTITVSDTGPGIPPDKVPFVFDRFYQVSDSDTRTDEGTGIGLALAKEYVELHHGDIKVDSVEGRGSAFIVTFLLGKDHFKPEEFKEINLGGIIQPDIAELSSGYPAGIDIKKVNDDKFPLILVVEDNRDLRSYIKSIMAENYSVIEASNGKEGLEMAIGNLPDLVISDVMMPEMNGYDLCKELKTSELTSHIPVILLTAKASKENKIEGLETGADDFITKPFDQQELFVRIENIITQREKLKKKFSRLVINSWPGKNIDTEDSDINSMDQKFMNKILSYLSENISDPDITVDTLSSISNISSRQLHRKIIALTGETPNKLIRKVRLNYAADLLKKKAGNVAEIAYEVGFNNLSWFSKCFKEEFGFLPSDLLND